MTGIGEDDASALVVSRVIDAPRVLVFEAWSDPAHVGEWWGPNGFTTTTSRHEFRPGGTWQLTMHDLEGRDYENLIIFEEIVPPQRVVYRMGGQAHLGPVQSRVTVSFDDEAGKTRVTIRHQFPNAEERNRVARDYGAEQGAVHTIGRLAGRVANQPSGADSEFAIIRVLDAPRLLVWKAYTDIAHLSQWWGPQGFAWIEGTIALKPGGLFHYAMRSPQGAILWGKFTFLEISAPEKLVFTNAFSDAQGNTVRAPFAPDFPLEVLNIVRFVEYDGKTVVAMRGTPFQASDAECARFAAMKGSMNQGFSAGFAALETFLARR